MLKEQGRLKNDLLVSTVMSNLGLTVACRKYGFKQYASKVGDRNVLEDMQRLGSVIGGEASGHVIFLNHHKTGDGILTAMQLISAMLAAGKPLSELAGLMDIYPQRLINVDVTHKPEISTLPQVIAAIKDVESALGNQGRVLVRYSGTQSMCRVMVEGPSDEVTSGYCRQIVDAVKASIG
jgi:phosphoglucosamine mutase